MRIDPIESPANWLGAEMKQRSDWMHRLSAEEIAEIDGALRAALARGIGIADIDRNNFPLPRFARLAQHALDFIENGPGLFLVRGIPLEGRSVDEAKMIYWALGKHLGTAMTQSRKGDVLGDVRDLDIFNTGLGRGYQSHRAQGFHTDSCDVVCLLVRHTAQSGGLSKIVSSIAMHNLMLAERPDLLAVLYQPMTMSTPDFGDEPWQQPIIAVHEGHFSARAASLYVQMAQRDFPDIPRLTPLQEEALEYYKELPNREGLHFTMMFQPGDLQLLNNHVTMHGRTGFTDYEDNEKKRHLLRLWLSVPNSRPLSPMLKQFWRDTRPGAARGGYLSRSGKVLFESLAQ